MDNYFSSVGKVVAKYGKASVHQAPSPEGAMAHVDIDFAAPIESLQIREYLHEYRVSLLVLTSKAGDITPITFRIVGKVNYEKLEEKSITRWSLDLQVVLEGDVHLDRLRCLKEHAHEERGAGGGVVWTDYIKALCFHTEGQDPTSENLDEITVIENNDYVLDLVNDHHEVVELIVPTLRDLGMHLKTNLHEAIDAAEEDVGRDVNRLIAAVDQAFDEFFEEESVGSLVNGYSERYEATLH